MTNAPGGAIPSKPRRDVHPIAVNARLIKHDITLIDADPELHAPYAGATAPLRSIIVSWITRAHFTASITLENSARMPSPAVSMTRPPCSLIIGKGRFGALSGPGPSPPRRRPSARYSQRCRQRGWQPTCAEPSCSRPRLSALVVVHVASARYHNPDRSTLRRKIGNFAALMQFLLSGVAPGLVSEVRLPDLARTCRLPRCSDSVRNREYC